MIPRSASRICVFNGSGLETAWLGQFSEQVLPGIEMSPANTEAGAHSKTAASKRLFIALSSERETQERHEYTTTVNERSRLAYR